MRIFHCRPDYIPCILCFILNRYIILLHFLHGPAYNPCISNLDLTIQSYLNIFHIGLDLNPFTLYTSHWPCSYNLSFSHQTGLHLFYMGPFHIGPSHACTSIIHYSHYRLDYNYYMSHLNWLKSSYFTFDLTVGLRSFF